MSTAVEINGVTLVPIKEAALRVKYSRDYVSRLAREGKIVASQVGRQWYIDLSSLERFSTEAETLESVRKEELRAERRRELMAKESLETLDTVVARRSRALRFDAAAVTAAVACLGLMVGAGMYTAQGLLVVSTGDNSALSVAPSVSVDEEVTLTLNEESPFRVLTEPQDVLVTSVTEEATRVEEAVVVPMTTDDVEGIFLFTEGESVDEAVVEAMFSDPVEVTFDDENSGVVRYETGEEVAKEYPFIRIPDVVSEEVKPGME